MVWKFLIGVVFLFLILCGFTVTGRMAHSSIKNLNHNQNQNQNPNMTGIQFPDHLSFNAVSSSSAGSDSGCTFANNKKSSSRTTHSLASLEDNYEEEEEEEDADMAKVLNLHQLPSVKLHLKHRSADKETMAAGAKDSVFVSTSRDFIRIQTLHTRIIEKKNQNAVSRINEKKNQNAVSRNEKKKKNTKNQSKPVAASPPEYNNPTTTTGEVSGQLMATLESGVSLGSGEYFMDVYIGTPPKHFSLILDTGSDLNWIQCVPCYDCFEQNGPFYNPKDSTTFQNITCHDPRCHLVSSPDPPQSCKFENQSCPYYYWYGDSSNTTGDFSLETFTVNLTTTQSGKSEFKKVDNVMFGCGHWNRGLFHGASGLLGLGRGPLSFSSQLQSLYGHSFSYCLVDRNSDSSVSSKLIFGEDEELLKHPQLNFTKLISGRNDDDDGDVNSVDTFYYVQIKSIVVGGEVLDIPEETWNLTPENGGGGGGGGTIVDSGTTLSYFADPAYKIIKDAFLNKVKNYRVVDDFPILVPCYNVSGVEKLDLPSFGIVFGDGAVWNFPIENYFIKIDPDEVVCLAILGTPKSALTIIGNYQQQNFHMLYDTRQSRLGYAPRKCSEI